jgi:hypothetical protein
MTSSSHKFAVRLATPPNKVIVSCVQQMSSSLRMRLRKRNASGDLEDSHSSSASPSGEYTKAALTNSSKAQASTPIDDLSSTPPPPASATSNARLPRDQSPPQSLLDRYKSRTAKLPGTNSPPSNPGSRSDPTVKNSAFNEHFDTEKFRKDASDDHDWSQASSKDARTLRAAEYEMAGRRSREAEGPHSKSDEDEILAYEPPQTRSQARRQKRIDSLSAPSDDGNWTPMDELSVPPGTAVTDDERYSSRHGVPLSLESYIATHASSPKSSSPTKTSSPVSSPPTVARFSASNEEESYLGSPSRAKVRDPILSPLPLSLSLRPRPLANGHKRSNSTTSVLVNPPNPYGLQNLASLWTSPLASTSRPTEPWNSCKRWNCCKCERRDPKGKAVQTIVEQNVCSRLECGHIRCESSCFIAPCNGFVPL